MSKAIKPKVCDLLGVELDEEFEYEDATFRIVPEIDNDEYGEQGGWVIEEKGKNIYTGGWDGDIEAWQLIDMIQHPEKIERRRWTKQNVEHAYAIKQLFCDAIYIQRYPVCHDGEYSYEAFDTNEKFIGGFTTKENLFPQLRIYDRARLSDILEEVGNET